MKATIILSILCIASLTYSTVSSAQTNAWTIITSARDTLRSCAIGRLEGDKVFLISGISVIQISVDSLSLLTRSKGSDLWSDAGYGTLVGSGVGALVGAASYHESAGSFAPDLGPGVAALGGAILGGVVGFTLGGIVGAASGGDEEYDLSQEPTAERIKILRYIRRDNR